MGQVLQALPFSNIFERDPTVDMNTLSEEELEELRMISGLDITEIVRLRKVFYKYTHGYEIMSKHDFMEIPCIAVNPLADRICLCFGFSEKKINVDFKGFLYGLSQFNAPGARETKMKIAFTIQDFDNDGLISKEDLKAYMTCVLSSAPPMSEEEGGLGDEEVDEIVNTVFKECSSDPSFKYINYPDFQRVVAPMDIQAKLRIPL